MNQKNTGFTLIELMIVVAIVGILASVALAQYQSYVRRTHVMEGLRLSTTAKLAIWDFFSANGTFPANNAEAGLASATSITGTSVNSIAIANSVITITYNELVDSAPNNTIVLNGSFDGGSLTWQCTGGTVIARYRSSDCRP